MVPEKTGMAQKTGLGNVGYEPEGGHIGLLCRAQIKNVFQKKTHPEDKINSIAIFGLSCQK